MPRTTLQIDDDALKIAKALALRRGITVGEAVSELVRQAADRPLVTDARNGLQVARLSRRSPKVTTARVDELYDEMAVIAKHRVRLARQAKAMVAEQAILKR